VRNLIQKCWNKARHDGFVALLEAIFRKNWRKIDRWRILNFSRDRFTSREVTLDLSGARVTNKMRIKIGQGKYESEEVAAIDKYISHRMNVVELGGCLGYTSCYTNKRLSNDSAHIVVEPNPDLESVLYRNRDINSCSFEIIQAAYSTQKNQVKLAIPKNIWGSSLSRKSKKEATVPSISLESILDEFGLSTFALIVDIEGSEWDLLENELDLLKSHCELLIIEFHQRKEVYSHLSPQIKSAQKKLESSVFNKIDQTSNDVAVYQNEQFQYEF